MVKRFIDHNTEMEHPHLKLTDMVLNASLHIQSNDLVTKLSKLRNDIEKSSYHEKFQTFLDTMANTDQNLKFWRQFVFQDALALFLAIRSGTWELRLASIKLMAPAFDHQTYRKLIAQHLADVHEFPDETHFKLVGS